MSLWDTIVFFGFAPWVEVALAVLLEILLGKPRFLTVNRAYGKLVGKLVNVVRVSLGRNARANHRTRALVVVLFVSLVTTAFVWGGAAVLNVTLGMLASSVYRIALMYLGLSFHREFFAALRTRALLKKGDKDGARAALSKVTDKDTENMSEQGLVRTATEEVGRAVSEGCLLPVLFACFGNLVFTPYGGRISAALMWGALSVYSLLRSCDVDFDNRPLFTATMRSVTNIVTALPSRLFALLCALLSFVLKLKYRESLTSATLANRVSLTYGRGWVFGSLSGSLAIRLGGGGYYAGAWKSAPTIGNDVFPPTQKTLKQSLFLTSLVLFAGVLLCLLSPVAATIGALMMLLTARYAG